MEVWNTLLSRLKEVALRRCLVALCMAVAFSFALLRPAEMRLLLTRLTSALVLLHAPLIATNRLVGGLE